MSLETKRVMRKILMPVFFVVAAALIFSFATSSLASAARYQDTTDKQAKLKMYLYGVLIQSCFQDGSHVETDNDRVDKGQFFYSQAGNAAPIVYSVSPQILKEVAGFGDDYWTGCGHDDGALTKAALRAWGINATDLVCGMGYVRDASGAGCKETTTVDYKSGGGLSDGGTRASKFTSTLRSLTGLDINNPGDDILYLRWKSVVVDACTTGKGVDASTATVSGALRYDLKEVGNNSLVTKVYSGGNKKSEKPHNTAISYTCGQALDNANRYADAYLKSSIEGAARTLCVGQGYQNVSGGSFPGQQTLSACINGAANKSNPTYCNGAYPDYAYQGSPISRQAERDACAWGQGQTVDVSTQTDADAPQPAAGEAATTCAVEAVGWIICPITTFMAYIADASFDFLANSFLEVKAETFNTSSSTYQAWGVMRNIANVAFVIAFIFIIFSQLTGMGVSNYGVKKMLPRIVVAAILVNVSFFITQIAIDISNILGYSIRQVFDAIATSSGIGSSDAVASDFATGGGFAGIAGLVLAGAVAGVALYAMLSTLIPVILAAVIALVLVLFILVARQAIVILLVILSPLAFVAFLLPNTERLFKAWRKMLTAMLLVFPIIALLFGASLLASQILTNTFSGNVEGDGSNMFGQIMAAAVLVLPLFAILPLLKKSLDGIPMVGQMANKFSGRANGAVSRKMGESYKNSAWGRGRSVRKQARQNYKDREFAKKVTNGGTAAGIAGFAAGGLGKTGQQQYIQQSLERSATTVAEKARSEDISSAASFMLEKHKDPSTQIERVAGELSGAIKSGDVTKARAAQSILLNSGGAGLDQLHKTLNSSIDTNAKRNSEVGTSLRTALNSAGLKGKNNALASWAYAKDTDKDGNAVSDDANKLESIAKSAGTFNGLSSAELGGQRPEILKAAQASGAITVAQAQAVLNSPDVIKDMDVSKRQLFEQVASGTSPSATSTSSSATTTATSATSSTSTPAPQSSAPTNAGGIPPVTAAQRARQTAEQAAQGTSGDGVFVVSHNEGTSREAQPAAPAATQSQPARQAPPARTAAEARTTQNAQGQNVVEGQHDDTIDRMSR